ncbi:unnamed protein product [Symbiodinium sp. CCMP2592]|nr:unnamed protein product [Symbiodinium sp. CCMP2592]
MEAVCKGRALFEHCERQRQDDTTAGTTLAADSPATAVADKEAKAEEHGVCAGQVLWCIKPMPRLELSGHSTSLSATECSPVDMLPLDCDRWVGESWNVRFAGQTAQLLNASCNCQVTSG